MKDRYSPNVLMIDDDAEYSARVNTALAVDGINVLNVSNVTTALEELSNGDFQVVIVDPHNESATIKTRLKELLPHLPRFRCIFHSPQFDLRQVGELGDYRGFAWILKQRDLSELVSLVGRAIRDVRPPAEPSSRRLLTSPDTLLPAIVDSTSDGIVSVTVNGNILSWNSGAERMFGYSASEIIGGNISLIFPPERHGEYSSAQREIRKGNSVEFESKRLRRDGSLLNVAVKLSPIFDKNESSVGIAAVIRDITDQVRTKQARVSQLRFEQLISELSANFINLPAQLIDREMNRALQLIGQFIHVDRSIVMLLDSDRRTLNCTHEWYHDAFDAAKDRLQNVSCVDSPWLMQNYLNGQLVVVEDVS
ncbi:MAG: PAS domain S-box-containing protein, partial [Pirellulaceae bacterium]